MVRKRGTVHIQYAGPEKVPQRTVDAVSEAMRKFAHECQLVVVLSDGALLESRDVAVADRFKHQSSGFKTLEA